MTDATPTSARDQTSAPSAVPEDRPAILSSPASLSSAFRVLGGHWVTGVAVVTTFDRHGAPFGLTMSAVTTLSIDPVQFLICIDNRSSTLAAMLQSGLFGINYLAAGQADLSRRFASATPDKFSGIPHRRIPTGIPVLNGCLAFAECAVHAALPGGDHRIVIGNVQSLLIRGGEPLVHFRGEYRTLL
jgi:3-hydroxy-9,10-secoandrosta-1,3,5(10)-triene-9,17-dione monooxygenase reductase component